MNAHDISGAFVWHRGPLKPVQTDDFYERYEQEQRDRWAVESLAMAMERERLRLARRDYFGVVTLLLVVASVCVAMLARGTP